MITDVDEIFKHFTNQNKLALRLGVTRQAISNWRAINAIPARRAIQIERLTEGKIKAVDMPILEDDR